MIDFMLFSIGVLALVIALYMLAAFIEESYNWWKYRR